MPTPARILDIDMPTIALIGRANVGKSTLFNKLIEEHKAMVSEFAGTTRTNNEGDILWRGAYIHIIDTGGQDALENEPFAEDILAQAQSALERAQTIVMVVDARYEPLIQETELARRLEKFARENGKRLLLAANKVDNNRVAAELAGGAWVKLGLGEPIPLSAANGRGVGDFLDIVYEAHQGVKAEDHIAAMPERPMRVSLIGKPNVGKSSLFNKLIGQDRVIVSDIAHTTREPFDTLIMYEQGEARHPITFVDTAGIRRKSKVRRELERGGVQKSIESIEKSDIILLVLDASETISTQDLQLGGLIEKRGKSVIIVLNKWDLAQDTSDAARRKAEQMVRSHFPHLDFAPILFVSGKTGFRVHQVFPLLVQVMEARYTQIPDETLAEFLEEITRTHRPSRGKGTRHPKLKGLTQINAGPPVFTVYVAFRTSLHRSYLNFIENKLRERFGFLATPIIINITKMKR